MGANSVSNENQQANRRCFCSQRAADAYRDTIIAIPASLLLPLLGKAKLKAQGGQCMSKATVFSFGAVLDEYLERDLGIVLAALLQGGPRSLGVKVRLERD
ncbi:MAG: hypothetical protein KA191_16150, partial [Verrucomicrobia bacterium]|nr:hypothetical protein [Verrucomicrobiota bacterium]MDI9380044.1 hypothetical protein [Verrucomicrobiota bacterium]